MSKRKQDKIVVALPSGGDELYNAAKKLAIKMAGIEQDPDIISVFSIARAHGYKTTSRFWHDELKELGAVLTSIDQARNKALQEAEKVTFQSLPIFLLQ